MKLKGGIKMKKLIMGFILIFGLVLSGCSQDVSDKGKEPARDISNSQQNYNTKPPQGITVNKIQFEVLKNIPSQVKQPFTEKGYQVIQNNDKYIIVIGSGEKRTGGYSISVTQVEDNEGKTIITVKETGPAQGEMTTQVITYPVVAIQIGNNISPNFVVENTKGEVFKKI